MVSVCHLSDPEPSLRLTEGVVGGSKWSSWPWRRWPCRRGRRRRPVLPPPRLPGASSCHVRERGSFAVVREDLNGHHASWLLKVCWKKKNSFNFLNKTSVLAKDTWDSSTNSCSFHICIHANDQEVLGVVVCHYCHYEIAKKIQASNYKHKWLPVLHVWLLATDLFKACLNVIRSIIKELYPCADNIWFCLLICFLDWISKG
jgi:hypothetical protein